MNGGAVSAVTIISRMSKIQKASANKFSRVSNRRSIYFNCPSQRPLLVQLAQAFDRRVHDPAYIIRDQNYRSASAFAAPRPRSLLLRPAHRQTTSGSSSSRGHVLSPRDQKGH